MQTILGRFRNPPERKNADAWLASPEFRGVTVLDPDGWDRRNFATSWAEKITREEMENRVVRSTVQIAVDSPMHPRNIVR